MSIKSRPILHSNLQHKLDWDFLDRQYRRLQVLFFWVYTIYIIYRGKDISGRISYLGYIWIISVLGRFAHILWCTFYVKHPPKIYVRTTPVPSSYLAILPGAYIARCGELASTNACALRVCLSYSCKKYLKIAYMFYKKTLSDFFLSLNFDT